MDGLQTNTKQPNDQTKKKAELWSLLNFIEPRKFPDMEKFQERFGNIKSQEQVRNLQRRLEPHLLRRIKEDVGSSNEKSLKYSRFSLSIIDGFHICFD